MSSSRETGSDPLRIEGTPLPPERLDSWKEVAGFLRRDVRTVQRWEKEEGLPVHRLRHGRLGSVYAVPQELNDWWESRKARIEAAAEVVPESRTRIGTLLGLSVVGLAIAGALGALLLRPRSRPQPERPKLVHIAIPAPAGTLDFSFGAATVAPPAISPDGRFVVFGAAGADGVRRLWLRALDSVVPRPLYGTEGAELPFWSPQSHRVAFFADRHLKTVDLQGSPASSLCETTIGRGGTWSADGTIVFAPDVAGGLYIVSESGGVPRPLTSVAHPDVDSHAHPSFLPDGRHFLYLVRSWSDRARPEDVGIYIGSVDGGSSKRLLGDVSNAMYAAPGYVLFVRDGALMALPFDAARLQPTGEATPLVPHVEFVEFGAFGIFSASMTGDLVYRSQSGLRQLAWLSRQGEVTAIGEPLKFEGRPRLSPDGRTAVVSLQTDARNWDLWRFDLGSGQRTRLTFGGWNFFPAWSPDGTRILFSSYRTGDPLLQVLSATGGEPSTVHLVQHEDQMATDWSQDGRFLLYVRRDWAAEPRKRSTDLWRYDVATKMDAAVVSTPADEEEAAISPDGKWLAYTSNETGRLQVFVRPFASATPRWQLSTEGGKVPQWRGDGRQIAYITENRRIVGNAFSPDTGVHTGSFEVLFSHPGLRAYNLSRDFKRALVTVVPNDELAEPLTLVMNWVADWENGPSAVR